MLRINRIRNIAIKSITTNNGYTNKTMYDTHSTIF